MTRYQPRIPTASALGVCQANLNHAKAQIDEVQALLDPDRIIKLKEMGHWPIPKEALTEEDKLRAELKKAKAQIRKLKRDTEK